jgi:hypothetical protein
VICETATQLSPVDKSPARQALAGFAAASPLLWCGCEPEFVGISRTHQVAARPIGGEIP